MQREERGEGIRSSKFNKWYKWVKGEGIPGYMKKGWGESRWNRVARYRMGNGMKGNLYWKEKEMRKCRMCEREEETWEHIWEECLGWGTEREWQEMVGEVLGENGEGEKWFRKLEKVRGEEGEEWQIEGGREDRGSNSY